MNYDPPKSLPIEKKYSLDEIKSAFFEAFHKKGKVTFPHPESDLNGKPSSIDEEYCYRVTNSRWEMMADGLSMGKEEVSVHTPVFVYGSNEAGIHGRGAALFARRHRGAVYGKGVGHYGNSYGIPTKNFYIKTLPLKIIFLYVKQFLEYASNHPELSFEITRIGCGLAGYKDEDIAPMFSGVSDNCSLPERWREIIDSTLKQGLDLDLS